MKTQYPWLKTALQVLGKVSLRVVAWIGGSIIVAGCWVAAWLYPKPLAITLAVAVSVFMVLVVLRATRGSLADAEDLADARQRDGQPVWSANLPARVRRALIPNEKILFRYREHVISLWQWWVPGIVLQPATVTAMVMSGSFIIPTVFWVGAMAAISVRFWLWYRSEMLVTDRRLMRVSGIISTKISIMPVKKVTDAEMDISALSKVLAWLRIINLPYGRIHVESAGQNQALEWLDWIPNANEVMNTVANEAVPGGHDE